MIGQIPLIYITKWLGHLRATRFGERQELFDTIGRLLYKQLGNYIFWISFTIVGQPTSVLMYYSNWYKRQVQ